MIGAAAMVLIVGKLYTLYNAKWLYIIFTVIFMAASAVCGAAPTMNGEIVGRVFAGVGGNGMYIGVLTLLSLNTTSRERPQYLSLTYVYLLAIYLTKYDLTEQQWASLGPGNGSGPSCRWWIRAVHLAVGILY